jgi:hypothetical protein
MPAIIISKLLLLVFFLIGIFFNFQITVLDNASLENKDLKDISVTLKESDNLLTRNQNGNRSFEICPKGKHVLPFVSFTLELTEARRRSLITFDKVQQKNSSFSEKKFNVGKRNHAKLPINLVMESRILDPYAKK